MDIYGYDPYPDGTFCAEHSVKLVSFGGCWASPTS